MKKLMSFVWMCLMSISMLSAQGVEEVTLVVSGDGATKEEAMSREYAIKQLTRAKKLALMEF